MTQENFFTSHLPSKCPDTQSQAIGIGKAHSKIILMGEHAVVYDYPAIALPFPAVGVTALVRYTQAPYSTLDCQYHHGPLDQAPSNLLNLVEAIDLTFETFKLGQPCLHIEIQSQIPQERGMGSSAAVSVAVVRAICHLFKIEITDFQLQLIVNQAEVIAHQSTSGLDTLMTSTFQPIIYRKSQHPHTFELNLPAYLIVADSGQAGQTRMAVQHVANLKERKPLFVEQSMATIGKFVQQAHDLILEQNIIELGKHMTYNHYYLNQLGVSNRHIDSIVNAAWMAGALGAKLTGGGRGGCIIALADTYDKAIEIEEAMRLAGAIQTWHLDLSQSYQ